MAYTVETRSENKANRLRDALEKAERLLISVTRDTIEEFLVLLDEIEVMFEDMAADRIDLRPEKTRWETLLQRLNSRPDAYVQAANRAGGYPKLREAHPPAESFWWHLDNIQAKNRRQNVQRMITSFVSIILVLSVGYWGLNTLFPPNPEAVILVDATARIDRAIMEEDLASALAVVRETLEQLPDDPDMLVWEGVLLEELDQQEEAVAALARAQARLENEPVYFWLLTGNKRLQVGNLEGAQYAGDAAYEIDPYEPQVLFMLGGIAEMRNDIATAVEYFDRTFQLAENDNPQLAVIARVRMGQLLQRPAGDLFDATPEPIPTPVP